MTSVVRPPMSAATASSSCASVVGVDAGGRLVEHHQVGVAQPHAGEREQLRLAGRQSGAAGAERRGGCRRRRARRGRPARARRSTASSVGAGSKSVTLSRMVPANSSTSWGIIATRRRSVGERDVGDGHAVEAQVARRSSRRGGAPAARAWSCRCRCARRRPSSGRRRVVTVDVAEHGLRRRRSRTTTWRRSTRERARRRRSVVPVVDDGRPHRQQVDDTNHRPVRLLHGLQLMDHVLQRTLEQQHVLEQQERRADGDRAARDTSSGAGDQRDHGADGHRHPAPPTTAAGTRDSRRTELRIVPALSSMNRHIAWRPAPLARRSSDAVSRSSMPP